MLSRDGSTTVWGILLAGAIVTACAGNKNPTDGRRDASAGTDSGVVSRDTGSRDTGRSGDAGAGCFAPSGCGSAGNACCFGTRCDVGLTCSSGRCTASASCGGVDDRCCPGNACRAGLVCDGTHCRSRSDCGAEDQPCCSGAMCRAGLVCDRDRCRDVACGGCGSAGRTCCAGNVCASAMVCTGGDCRTPAPCGGPRERCCSSAEAERPCHDGLACNGTVCETDALGCGTEGTSCCPTGDPCNGDGSVVCCGGECTDTTDSDAHCGGCNMPCSTGCENSACPPTPDCSALGEPCCASPLPGCDTGLECRDSVCQRPITDPACKPPGQDCTSDAECCGETSNPRQVGCRPTLFSGSDSKCCGEVGAECESDWNCCGRMSCGADHRCKCRTGTQSCKTDADCCSGLTCDPSSKECTTDGEDPCGVGDINDCETCTRGRDCSWCIEATGSTLCVSSPSGICERQTTYSAFCNENDRCASAGNCGDCNQRDGCGWCPTGATAGNCVADSSAGGCTNFIGDEDQCGTDPCRAVDGMCKECVARPGCDFCDSNDTCFLEGTDNGCTDVDTISWACDDTDACLRHENCGDCVADTSCGWCLTPDGARCVTGDVTDPDRGPATDTCSFWQATSAQCGEDPCLERSADGCAICNERDVCGWCADRNLCVIGGSTPPAGLDCLDWQPNPSECAPYCGSATTCDTCIDLDHCGFCETRATCEPGDNGGSYLGGCRDWETSFFLTGICDNTTPCGDPSLNTCETCTANSDGYCGWCILTGQCVPIDRFDRVERPSECSGAIKTDAPQCAMTIDPCSSGQSCKSCRFLIDGNTCGWCAADDTCRTGNVDGPTMGGTCGSGTADWLWGPCGV